MEPDEVARMVADLKLSGATEAKVVRAPAANTRLGNKRLANVVVGGGSLIRELSIGRHCEGNLEERIVLIRYEKLPEFCSACGRVGHATRHCFDETVDKEASSFSPWLRAGKVMDSRRGGSDWRRRAQNPGSRAGSERSRGGSSEANYAAEGTEVDGDKTRQFVGQGGVGVGEMAGVGNILDVHPLVEGGLEELDGTLDPRVPDRGLPQVIQEGDDGGCLDGPDTCTAKQENKRIARPMHQEIGPALGMEMARGEQLQVVIGKMNKGVAERRWKQRARETRHREGDEELMDKRDLKRQSVGEGEGEEPATKVPRRNLSSRKLCDEESLNVTVATAKQPR